MRGSEPVSRLPLFVAATLLALVVVQGPADAAVARNPPTVGEIVRVDGGADIRLVRSDDWLAAEASQQLLPGDDLRTGSLGTLAILFTDRTQIRLHRNAFLTIKAIAGLAGAKNSELGLKRGRIWSRATRGVGGVRVETPAATAAIRGTDWTLAVDENERTTLVVLDGSVVLENELGQVTVTRGEIAFAEIGKAPNKTILVRPKDREQILYNLSLPDSARLFPLTDTTTAQRRERLAKLEAVAPAERSGAQWLDLAELAYDQGELTVARAAVAAGLTVAPELAARGDLVIGYLALYDENYPAANRRLAAAAPRLDRQRRRIAGIGRVFALLSLRDGGGVEALLAELEQDDPDASRYRALRLALSAFAGDLPAAMAQARAAARLHPNDPMFPALEAILALTLDRSEQVMPAARRALTLDPGFGAAHQAIGLYLNDYQNDSEGAVEAFQRGIDINSNNTNLWGGLALAYYNLNEQRKAEQAFRYVLERVPNDLPALVNFSVLLLDQDRVEEARALIERAAAIDPFRDVVFGREGRLAMQTDQMDLALDRFLKSTTTNPALSESSLGLAMAYYQRGELKLARQTLDNAERLDPRDPLVPLVGAIIAQDQAEADIAIDFARKAIDLYRAQGGKGATALAASRGGATSLGSAYANLNLNAWADYHGEMSFDPYAADSYFFRATQNDGSLDALTQGVLLEPLAVSARNRFVDFFRRPFSDAELGLSLGWPEQGASHGESLTVQGFSTGSVPVSYFLTTSLAESPGSRENADSRSLSGSVFVGMNLTPHDGLVLSLSHADTDSELPGTVQAPDFDDRQDSELTNAAIGYTHHFAARDKLLTLLTWQRLSSTFRNPRPFGTGLSTLDYSLASSYTLDFAEFLHAGGLSDVTDPAEPEHPILQVGSADGSVPNTLTPGLDTNPVRRTEFVNDTYSLQLRRLFTVGDVDLSLGAGAALFQRRTERETLDFVLRNPGVGTLLTVIGDIPFVYGDAVPNRVTLEQQGYATMLHANALWRIDRDWWLEGGLFVDHYDDDLDERFTRWQPRAGAAWQVSKNDWLRVAVRQDTAFPTVTALSPLATVGLLPDDDYLSEGSRSTSYLARWDREWTPRLFTALEIGRQEISDFNSSAPGIVDSFDIDKASIEHASLSANLWLPGGFGLFAKGTLRGTENRDAGLFGASGLPLVPEQELSAGLTWVHPSQLRVSLIGRAVGRRPANDFSGDKLDAYNTLDVAATWQPLAKQLQLGLTVTNLTDADYEFAEGYPGPGRMLQVSGAWRF